MTWFLVLVLSRCSKAFIQRRSEEGRITGSGSTVFDKNLVLLWDSCGVAPHTDLMRSFHIVVH